MRLLIVEDHLNTRRSLKRYFTRLGHEVAAAADAKTGVELLRKQQFDAIICDIILPDGTGYAVIHEARRRGAHALGIAITGYGYPADVEQPKLTGFDYHLMKPVKCEELRSLLEQGRRKPQS